MFSKWPKRHISGTLDDEVAATPRLAHFLLEIGRFQLQFVVIYGLAHSNTDKQNLELLQQALAATDHFNLLFAILRDFSCNPMALLHEDTQARHLADLKLLYHALQRGHMA